MPAKPLSREKLLGYGVCCGNKCRNCPYVPKYQPGAKQIASQPATRPPEST